MRQASDEALLRAVARREEAALLELHRRYAPAVRRVARTCRRPADEAAVHSAFLAVWRQAHCFERARVPAPLWVLLLARWTFTQAASPRPLSPPFPTRRQP